MTREQELELLLRRHWKRADETQCRLARIFHDRVIQHATALRLGLTSLQRRLSLSNAGEDAEMDRLVRTSADLADDLAAAISDLRFGPPDVVEIEAAIEQKCKTALTRLGVAVHFRPIPLSHQPASVQAILSILEGALTNVAEHAGVSEAEVRLEETASQFRLTVSDRGRGFSSQALGMALGLAEMREWAAMAGGTLEINSDSGTTVTFRLPIAQAAGSRLAGSTRPKHILIADDHALVRHGLAQILREDEDHCVDEVATIPALRAYLTRRTPDLLLLDINMPGGSGIEMLGEVKRRHARLPVLMLSVQPEERAGVQAILAGAQGYLSKSAQPEQLKEAVRRVMSGRRFISPKLSEAMAAYLQTPPQEMAPHHQLSARELTVLKLIAEGNTTADIGRQMHISPKTVATYRVRIAEKLRMKSTAELTRYAIENRLIGGNFDRIERK